ncbi:unnamed protein product, partial [Brassica oleracea var. botrytis]
IVTSLLLCLCVRATTSVEDPRRIHIILATIGLLCSATCLDKCCDTNWHKSLVVDMDFVSSSVLFICANA